METVSWLLCRVSDSARASGPVARRHTAIVLVPRTAVNSGPAADPEFFPLGRQLPENCTANTRMGRWDISRHPRRTCRYNAVRDTSFPERKSADRFVICASPPSGMNIRRPRDEYSASGALRYGHSRRALTRPIRTAPRPTPSPPSIGELVHPPDHPICRQCVRHYPGGTDPG